MIAPSELTGGRYLPRFFGPRTTLYVGLDVDVSIPDHASYG